MTEKIHAEIEKNTDHLEQMVADLEALQKRNDRSFLWANAGVVLVSILAVAAILCLT